MHLFSKSKPYSTTSYEHVSILTLGGLFTHFYYIQKEFSFKLDDCGVVVINQPIEAFVIVSSVTRILQLIKKQAFLSAVIKEFAHAFSCAYIELWMHLGSLESTQEARVALGCASSYS